MGNKIVRCLVWYDVPNEYKLHWDAGGHFRYLESTGRPKELHRGIHKVLLLHGETCVQSLGETAKCQDKGEQVRNVPQGCVLENVWFTKQLYAQGNRKSNRPACLWDTDIFLLHNTGFPLVILNKQLWVLIDQLLFLDTPPPQNPFMGIFPISPTEK